MRLIALFPPGIESEGIKELEALGGLFIESRNRIVSFEADKACLYRLYLQARLPFRFLREMARFPCNCSKSLYEGIRHSIDWKVWLPPSKSFRVDVSGFNQGLTHSHFSALQVKNALVDFQRSVWGERSDIDLTNPQICLHVHFTNNEAILSLDGSGSSLHRRGYRSAMGVAPLKENLAAGLIRLTSWNGATPLVDLLCGSGTFLIEAAQIALDLSPGLTRDFLLKYWADFDKSIWDNEKKLAKQKQSFSRKLPKIIGCENNLDIANQAKANIQQAGLSSYIEIKPIDFSHFRLPEEKGLIVCNPPYGKRLGFDQDLSVTYKKIGTYLKENAAEWTFWLLSGNPNLTKELQMKCSQRIPINNGGIDCRWLKYNVY